MITKKDSSKVAFDMGKIRTSLLLAFDGAGEMDLGGLDDVYEQLHATFRANPPINTEDVAGCVESMLLDCGYYEVAKHYIIYREERRRIREDRLDNKNVILGLTDYIHASKYAQPGENWEGTVDRWRKFMGLIVSDPLVQAIQAKKLLPSMRSLQFSGPALDKQPERMYNCSYTHLDRVEAFGEILYLLLCGCGVGFGIELEHIEKLPKVLGVGEVKHHTVEDSIEGWSEAVSELLKGYLVNGKYVEMNYSLIRARGEMLRTSGGRAPGHQPLKLAIENIRGVLENATGRQLRPIECLDIICYLGEAVLSGGIRRSSLICLFNDTETLYAKTGNWMIANSQRAICNNTMVLDPSNLSGLDRVLAISQYYGEPGFTFLSPDLGLNPCGEIVIEPPPKGFGFCNLVEINLPGLLGENEFYEMCSLGARAATLQRWRCPPRLGTAPDIGVSITGVQDVWGTWLTPTVLSKGHSIVNQTQVVLSKELGLVPAKRVCCVKPSGTASLLLGAVGSGIHMHQGARYFRRIIGTDLEPAYQLFKKVNPHMIGPRGHIIWPIEAANWREMNAMEFLEIVEIVQRCWCSGSHNVSCTVTLGNEEISDVTQWIRKNKPIALSFAPKGIEDKYPDAPRQAVKTRVDEASWNNLIKHYKRVDYSVLEEQGERGNACEGAKCEIKC